MQLKGLVKLFYGLQVRYYHILYLYYDQLKRPAKERAKLNKSLEFCVIDYNYFQYRYLYHEHVCLYLYGFLDEIRDIFEKYGYRVKGLLDATASDMIGYIVHCSREACSGTFICFISSHGSRTTLQSGTKSPIRLAAILEMAYDRNQCRTNVFFIDACRKHLSILLLLTLFLYKMKMFCKCLSLCMFFYPLNSIIFNNI